MTRNPAAYAGTGTPVQADVHHPGTLGAAMAGGQAAYYLVHSLSDADFERKDAGLRSLAIDRARAAWQMAADSDSAPAPTQNQKI